MILVFDFQLPGFFYAVEEDRYFDPINIFILEALKPRSSILDTLCGWTEAMEKEEGES